MGILERAAAAGAAVTSAEQQELWKLKSEFFAGLNHEIRTPLSGIVGMTDLLMETPLDDSQKEYVAATRTCAEELLEQLNSALEFLALAAGRLALEESDFDLLELLKTVAAQHQPSAQAKGLRLRAAVDETLPQVVVGDAVRLREVISHLLRNAIQFTRHGEVELKAAAGVELAQRFRLQIAVRDTGIGIAPEQLESLFQSFRHGDIGLVRSRSGPGLGLALVHALVRLMGGEVRAQSEPGKGSVLSFWVPLRVSEETPGADELVEPAPQRRHILVVEDHGISKHVISHMLLRARYRVEHGGLWGGGHRRRRLPALRPDCHERANAWHGRPRDDPGDSRAAGLLAGAGGGADRAHP